MSVEDDDKTAFLDLLEIVPPEYILYHEENLFAPTSVLYEKYLKNDGNMDMYYKDIIKLQRAFTMPKGIDFDDVKHYPYEELVIFTNDTLRQYILETSMYGRFLRGSIKVDSEDKNVIIKTWDLHYPRRNDMNLQVVRLHSELTFLMDVLKRRPHRCLPKLIGYSIDKRLAVIYDLNPAFTLSKLLETRDNFSWKKRLYSAIEVANMMCYFHADNIIIGSIDSKNLIYDKDEVNLKLCDFGLTIKSQNIVVDEDYPSKGYISGRSYRQHSEQLYLENGGEWTICSDIFAFGYLLLELIFVSKRRPSTWMKVVEVLPSDKPMPEDFGPLDTSIIEDVELGVNLRKLAWKCLQVKPSDRPKAKYIYNELISIMDKAYPVSKTAVTSSSHKQEIGKTCIGESKGLAGDRSMGIESLEKQVYKKTYSLEDNLTILRCYQIEPKRMNTDIVAFILVKALMAKPAPDFGLCLGLIPKKVQKKKPIKTLIALSDFLETANFSQLWDKAGAIHYFLKYVPGFEQAIRAYAIHILSRTSRRVSKSVLAKAINIKGPALTTFIDQQVRNNGWVREINDNSSLVIVLPSNESKPSRA